MTQVKFFSGIPGIVMKRVDEWIEENPDVEIITAAQSETDSHISFTLVYKEKPISPHV